MFASEGFIRIGVLAWTWDEDVNVAYVIAWKAETGMQIPLY